MLSAVFAEVTARFASAVEQQSDAAEAIYSECGADTAMYRSRTVGADPAHCRHQRATCRILQRPESVGQPAQNLINPLHCADIQVGKPLHAGRNALLGSWTAGRANPFDLSECRSTEEKGNRWLSRLLNDSLRLGIRRRPWKHFGQSRPHWRLLN